MKTRTYTVTIAADVRAYATVTIEATSRDAAWQRAKDIAASQDIFAEPELHGVTTFKPDYDTLCEFEALEDLTEETKNRSSSLQ